MDESNNSQPVDPRFSMGLVHDVCNVLQEHGYVPAPKSEVYADVLLDLFRLVRHFEGHR